MERLRAVRTRKYAIFQYTCRREPRPVAAAPSTCSLRKSLTWNGVMPERHPPTCAILRPRTSQRAPGFSPGQGRIGRFQWIIGSIPQVPGAVRHGSCAFESAPSARPTCFGVPHGGLYQNLLGILGKRVKFNDRDRESLAFFIL